MSLALSTGGIILDQVKSNLLNRHRNTQISASLSSGGYLNGLGGTSISPQYNYEESVNYGDTIVTLYPNGMEQRISTVSATRRQFNLNFKILTKAELDELWQFYQDHRGQTYPFVYVEPMIGNDYVVRFVNKSMSRTLFAYLLESTGLQLAELIGE